MFDRKQLGALVVLVGTLALTRCSGGNDVTGINGNRAAEPPTATPVAGGPAVTPAPHAGPTPTPQCPPRFQGDCPLNFQ